MSRGPATFRQRDLTAAIRAAEKAGKQVYRVRIARDGQIELITSQIADERDKPEGNEWDGVGAGL